MTRRHVASLGSGSATSVRLELVAENQSCDSLGCIRLQWTAYVRVDVGGDALAGVIEPVLDDLHRDAGLECQRRPVVSLGVDGDHGYRGGVRG